MKSLHWIVLLAAAALTACGGGGGDAGTSPFGNAANCTTSTSSASGATGACLTAANLSLQLSSTSILNSGAATVTATAVATTATGQALSGIPVSFSVDNGATFTQSSAVTDASGKASAVVSIGSDPSNRIITVTATNGSLSKDAAFAVTGAKLTGTPVPAIVTPGSTGNKVDFRLVDANGAAMVGQKITVTASSLASVDGVTGINGDYSYVYTAPAASGPLDIMAAAGGVTNTQTVIVQAAGNNTVPPATDAAGNPAVISSASVSANPSVVSTNTSTTNNRTEIRALFVGPNNTPLKNVRVRFDLAGDANNIGGTFSTGANVVYSDTNGIATTAYIPGTRSSPTNGVTIRACYGTVDFTACTTAATTTITVASDPLSVTIGSNNQILVGPTNLTYRRQFVVLVVDASGRAKANVDVVPSIDLPIYFKGQYVHGAGWFTGQEVVPRTTPPTLVARNPVACINEDSNRNGVLESTEDVNHSGSIEPRKSDATITIIGTGKTDDNGSAVVQVEYPQNVGSWLQVRILVSATGVSGTEGRATWTEILPVPVDTLSATATPPFAISPYGVVIDPATVSVFPDGTAGAANVQPCNNPY